GIDGAPVGTFVCYLIIAVLNIVQIIKYAKIQFRWSSFVIKPLLAALIMGAVGFVLGTFVTNNSFLLNEDINVWLRRIVIVGEIGVCAIVYLLAAFGVGAIQKADILHLPKGEKLAAVLNRMKLLK
ncbi:MAG: polysaccharide biosynthesis C-terminal domain-containing protein, partial [Clostridia bacterium]|nr:polysaccharide biosynthesis C-terminal domain-containing protein [Clostridia bacterium]